MEWRKDGYILERIALAERLNAAGLSRPEIREQVSKWSLAQGEIEISLDTVATDLARSRELWAERATDARGEHLAGLSQIKRQALSAFAQTPTSSLNRSAYLSVAAKCEVDAARIDGSLNRRRR
ncbi:MAG: hypothetical protein ACYDC5_05355 [Candidatus Dormibacteria bacterium]